MSGILHKEPESLLSHLPDGLAELERMSIEPCAKIARRYQNIADLLIDLKDQRANLMPSQKVLYLPHKRNNLQRVRTFVSTRKVNRGTLFRKYEFGCRQRLLLRRND
jgi:hypothetical protein